MKIEVLSLEKEGVPLMKVLTVVTHPRTNSLTFAVADRFVQGLIKAGHETEVLDLLRSGFDPVLGDADEPDWTGKHKQYSTEVEQRICLRQ